MEGWQGEGEKGGGGERVVRVRGSWRDREMVE